MTPSQARSRPAEDPASHAGARLRLPAPRALILVVACLGLLAVIYGGWELVERRFLLGRVDQETLHLLHMLRGIASSLVLAGFVGAYLLRQPAGFFAVPREQPGLADVPDPQEVQRHHARWFVNLRWVATVFLLGMILIAVPVARILPMQTLVPLLVWWSLLPLANLAFTYWARHGERIQQQIVVQALVDLVILTGLLNASGGMENPLYFVYLFHVIIANILLSGRRAFMVTMAAGLLVSVVALGEYLQLLPHYTNLLFPHEHGPVPGAGGHGDAGHVHDVEGHAAHDLIFVLGRWLPFLGVLALTGFFTRLVAERLRESQSQLERAVRRLTLEHQRLERVVESAGIGMMLVAPELEVVWSSRRAADWLELADGQFADRCPLYRTPGGCQECIAEATLRSGDSRESERCVVTADGERRYFRHVTSPVLDAEGRTIQVVELLEDATARKALEAEALHHGKLSVLGQMAAGIAHEIGNPLSSLSTRLELMERRSDPEFLERSIELLRGQIGRISRIVQCVSSFGRTRGEEWTLWPVNAVLQEAVDLVAMDRRAKLIDFDVRFAEPSPRVRGVRDQISQVFLNLLLNAVEAMPEGGPIRVETAQEGGRVNASVIDSGVGMSVTVQRRIFEPFFTSKHEGTGLGLAICYSFVNAHGGSIEVDSREGQGSRFDVVLPAAASVTAQRAAEGATA